MRVSVAVKDMDVENEESLPVFGRLAPGVVYRPRPGAYAVARDRAGRVATVRTPRGLYLPGGGIKSGESPEDALEREVREECGHAIQILHTLGRAVEYLYRPSRRSNIMKCGTFFAVEFTYVFPEGCTEADHALVWLSPAQAQRWLKHGSHRWAVERALTPVRPPDR